jgi:hypothetical protein
MRVAVQIQVCDLINRPRFEAFPIMWQKSTRPFNPDFFNLH